MHKTIDGPTTTRFIPTVMDRTECKKHNALLGLPCFLMKKTWGYYGGICDQRARKAGFVGKISPEALSKVGAKRSKK